MQYKKTANKVMEGYISSQAIAIGVPEQDIKNRLNSRYSFEDVDRVCTDLREQYFNLSRLPFSVAGKVGVVVTEQTSQPAKARELVADDDCVDADLLRLAKLT